jgi:hypothetical protein
MNRTLIAILPAVIVLLNFVSARPAAAQVPFFGRGATIFDPEIGVVQSGIVNDVQATVSADRKYVTMTMRATNAQLLALREFAFQVGNGGAPAGFVGGAGAAGNGAAGNGAAPAPAGGAGAGGGDGRASILDRPGMTLLGRANNPRPRDR